MFPFGVFTFGAKEEKEPKPAQAQASKPKPVQAQASKPMLVQAQASKPKPVQAQASKPKPVQAQASESMLMQIDGKQYVCIEASVFASQHENQGVKRQKVDHYDEVCRVNIIDRHIVAENVHNPATWNNCFQGREFKNAAIVLSFTDKRGVDAEGRKVGDVERVVIVKHNTGALGVPGGAIDATDETPFHAAVREFEEEVHSPLPALSKLVGMLICGSTVIFEMRTSYHFPIKRVIVDPQNPGPNPEEVHEVYSMSVDTVIRNLAQKAFRSCVQHTLPASMGIVKLHAK